MVCDTLTVVTKSRIGLIISSSHFSHIPSLSHSLSFSRFLSLGEVFLSDSSILQPLEYKIHRFITFHHNTFFAMHLVALLYNLSITMKSNSE